jgi:mannose-1-phosphate guanylyltransferase
LISPVLLSGGVGSRLWPVSREQYPKQFIPLVEENTSMLQSTYLRTALIEKVSPIVVCNEAHRFLVAEQLRSAGAEHAKILLEPCGRNTAPAAALAALCALEQSSDARILLLPADHVILDAQAFGTGDRLRLY